MRISEGASGHSLTSVVASAFWCVFSAKGAAFTSKPGATPQDLRKPENNSAESAIHFRRKPYQLYLGIWIPGAMPRVRHGESVPWRTGLR